VSEVVRAWKPHLKDLRLNRVAGEDRASDARFGAKPSLCGENTPNFLSVT